MGIWTSIKNNKKKLIFFLALFIIGTITGIIIFFNQPDLTKEAINIELSSFGDLISNSHQNQIFFHTLIVAILLLLSFTVIGYLGVIFYLFYEGCSFGFSISVFAFKYKVSGVFFSILFNVLTKLMFWLIIFYICFIGLKIIKKIIGSLVLKRDELTYPFLKRYFIILGILVSISLINETIIYFLANKVLKLFLFLL